MYFKVHPLGNNQFIAVSDRSAAVWEYESLFSATSRLQSTNNSLSFTYGGNNSSGDLSNTLEENESSLLSIRRRQYSSFSNCYDNIVAPTPFVNSVEVGI